MSTDVFHQLINIAGESNVRKDEYLKNHTYTKLGGKADFFVTPEHYEAVQKIIQFCHQEQIPFTLIGNGSNLIVRDGGIRGVVLSLMKLNEIKTDGTKIIAQSGASIIDTSKSA